MSAVLDIINPEKMKELAEKLTSESPPHVVKWFTSTWFTWLCKQSHLLVRVLPEAHKSVMNHQLAMDIRAMYDFGVDAHVGMNEEDEDDEDDDEEDFEESEDDDADAVFARWKRTEKQRILVLRRADPTAYATEIEAFKRQLEAYKARESTAIDEYIQQAVAAGDKPKLTKLPIGRNKFGYLEICADALCYRRESRMKFISEADTPEWARKKLALGLPVYYVLPGYARKKIDLEYWKHVRDYANTLPERQIRHTVDAMEKAVDEWDKALLRQKEIADLEKGTNLVKDFGNGWKVFHFIEKAAFEAEGSVMKHCISSYANKDSCKIYTVCASRACLSSRSKSTSVIAAWSKAGASSTARQPRRSPIWSKRGPQRCATASPKTPTSKVLSLKTRMTTTKTKGKVVRTPTGAPQTKAKSHTSPIKFVEGALDVTLIQTKTSKTDSTSKEEHDSWQLSHTRP